jgi:hypothetical protein
MEQGNLERLGRLDVGTLSIGDLSNLKDSILREALIDVAEWEEGFQLQTSHQNHTSHADHVTHQSSDPILP